MIKKFESFQSDDIDELKEYISVLEEGIRKRDELIYAMMKGNSLGYQHFMVNKSMGIDELRTAFKVDEISDLRVIRERIKLLGKELR